MHKLTTSRKDLENYEKRRNIFFTIIDLVGNNRGVYTAQDLTNKLEEQFCDKFDYAFVVQEAQDEKIIGPEKPGIDSKMVYVPADQRL